MNKRITDSLTRIYPTFGLQKIKKIYNTLLPCLTLLLSTLLTAQNDYERKNGTEKIGKHDMATKVCPHLFL